jgi:non-specific serine/threonine protein kinase
VDWSYGLLGDAEKTLLQRVSVFAGGWTLEAAEQVCSGGPISRGDILNLLTSLVDKSLLVADTQGESTRYGLLETVRHFSRDRLGESGDEEAVRARHFDYLLTLAVQLDEAPDDAIASSCLRQVENEFDNLRSAMSWCVEDASRAVSGILLAGRLYWFWDKRGYYGEGRGWLTRLLAAGKQHNPGEPHARALHAAGTLALLQGDTLAAEQHHTAALGVWRQLGDRRQELRSLGSLGNIHYQRSELDQAHDLYEQAVGVARQLDDRRAIVVGLINLAYLTYHRRDLMASARCAQESLELGRQGRAWAIPQAATHLALIRYGQGDITAAKTFVSEADTCRAELGLRWPFCMVVQGMIARHEGDFTAARTYLKEALLEAQASGELTIIVESLEASAGLAVDLDNPRVAVGLWGLADLVRKEKGISIPGPDADRRDREMALARASIGGEMAFNKAWDEGSGWTIDEAVRCAVEI